MTSIETAFGLLLLQGAIAPPHVPQWYEQVSGILAIPVTMIGVAYSYVLIKKTRLEARKTELEINEKLNALAKDAVTSTTAPVSPQSTPLFTFRTGTLLLRYVLLQLILSLSGIVRQPLSYLFKGIGYGSYFILDKLKPQGELPAYIGLGFVKIGDVADTVLYWTIFLLIGWPLFKDILVALDVSTKEMSVSAIFRTMKDWRKFLRKVRDAQ